MTGTYIPHCLFTYTCGSHKECSKQIAAADPRGGAERSKSADSGSSSEDEALVEAVVEKTRSVPPADPAECPVTASTANGQVVIEVAPTIIQQSPQPTMSDNNTLPRTPRPSKNISELKIPAISHLSETLQRMLCGRPDADVQAVPKTITIYNVVSYHDCRDLRMLLWDHVYPVLSEMCAVQGFELQVLDLTWGLPDPWADDHTVREVFLTSLSKLQLCPYSILKEDFESLLEKIENEADCNIINQWYHLKQHNIPMTYTLRPISDHITNYGSNKQDVYELGCEAWQKIEEDLARIFFTTADEEFHAKYLVSDVESTLSEAVFSQKIPQENIIWFWSKGEVQLEESHNNNTANEDSAKVDNGTANESKTRESLAEYNRNRLQNTLDRLKQTLDPATCVDISDYPKDGASEIIHQYLQLTKDIIERILAEHEKHIRQRAEISGKGIPLKLYDDLIYQTIVSTELLEQCVDSYRLPEILTEYIINGNLLNVDGQLSFIGVDEDKRMINGFESMHTDEQEINEYPHDDSEAGHTSFDLQESINNIENIKNAQKDFEFACDEDDDEMTSGVNDDAVRPLVLTAGAGCGKSTTSVLLSSTVCDLPEWSNAVCIQRFISTAGCCTIQEIIASVLEQICFICDINLNIAHTSIVSHPKVFANILTKIPVDIQTLIILDGLEHICIPSSSAMEWLPIQLPRHVRLVLTMTQNCDIFRTLREKYPKGCFHYTMPNISAEIAQEIFQKDLEKETKTIPQEVLDKAIEQVQASCNPLQARLAASCCILWVNEKDVLNALRQSLDDQIAALIEYAQLKMGVCCCGHLLSCINESRMGLSEMELIDILTGDTMFLGGLYCYIRPDDQPAVPLHIWLQAKAVLLPLLREVIVDGVPLLQWRHAVTGLVVHDMYDLGMITTVQSLMLDYFTDKWSSGPPYSHIKKRVLLKRNPLCFGKSVNKRRLREAPWLMVLEHRIEDLDSCLFDLKFLCDKLAACGVYQVLHDISLMLRLVPSDADAVMLQQVLQHCSAVLSHDAGHLPVLLYLLHREGEIQVTAGHPKIQLLLDAINDGPSIPFLVPSDPSLIQTFTLLSTSYTAELSTPKWQGLFQIPDHPFLMISIGTETGELIVWDIINQTVIRRLTSLRLPRDVRPITSTRAVVLCDRELRVLNLDEGRLEAKLKGVLNLKMPYFNIHNNEHVIALSRNRMEVTLINLTSGDMVATFKAGEDRFLNSLLVSPDGMTCACGDEVQKPFPILIWDLHKRKLVHDLRIHGHEFLMNIAAITYEGHYIVSVCKTLDDDLPTFLIVYDLQSGTLFKKWRPSQNVTSVAISSVSNVVVSAQEDGVICVWDMVGGTLKYELNGPSCGANRLSLDSSGQTCISWDASCRDTTLWMWDVAQGVCLGAFPSELGFSCCQISPDGSMVVVGVSGRDDIITLRPLSRTTDDTANHTESLLFGDSSRHGSVFEISGT